METAASVCIVLPCFNEGRRITSSVATLTEWFGEAAEILIVDDGSTDDTFEQAQQCAGRVPQVRVHRLPRHLGKGGAMRAAIDLVRVDEALFVDADLAFSRESMHRALDGLKDAEMVIGNRRHDGSYYSVPVRLFGYLYRRHLVGLLFNAVVRLGLGLRQRDTQCGLKAFRRTCLERIAPALSVDGFAVDVEILLVAQALGIRPAEVPVDVRYESGKSSVSLLASGWPVAADLLRIMSRRARGLYAPRGQRRTI